MNCKSQMARISWCEAIIVFLVTVSFLRTTNAQSSIRAEFSEKLANVHQGMDKNRVVEILGQPDSEVLGTREQPLPGNAHGYWCYGKSPRFGIPTLGFVEFNADGIVKRVFGDEGTPIDEAILSEAEIAAFFDVFGSINPRYVVDPGPYEYLLAINAIKPLQKKRAFALLREYCRVMEGDPDFDVYALLFLINEPKETSQGRDGRLRKPAIGLFVSPAGRDPEVLFMPRYPYHLLDGIPVRLYTVVICAGVPERATDYLNDVESNFLWNPEPLPINEKSRHELEREIDSFYRHCVDYMDEDLPGAKNALHDLLTRQVKRFIESRDASKDQKGDK